MSCHRLKGFMEDDRSSKVVKFVDNIKVKKVKNMEIKNLQHDLDKLVKFLHISRQM